MNITYTVYRMQGRGLIIYISMWGLFTTLFSPCATHHRLTMYKCLVMGIGHPLSHSSRFLFTHFPIVRIKRTMDFFIHFFITIKLVMGSIGYGHQATTKVICVSFHFSHYSFILFFLSSFSQLFFCFLPSFFLATHLSLHFFSFLSFSFFFLFLIFFSFFSDSHSLFAFISLLSITCLVCLHVSVSCVYGIFGLDYCYFLGLEGGGAVSPWGSHFVHVTFYLNRVSATFFNCTY